MPFFLIAALFVAGFVAMLLLAPKPKLENAKAAQLSDFQFPRSKEGDPVPRIYGTIKSKGLNTIGQCDFVAKPIKKKVKTGIFSSKKVTTGYEYHTGLDLAVCLGPGVVYRRLWYGNHLIWAGCLYGEGCVNRIHINLPNLLGGVDKNGGIGGFLTLYCGSFTQPQDSYLQEHLKKPADDDQVTGYPGIAHIVFEEFYWGNSPNIDTISAEVSFFTNGLDLDAGRYVMANGLDANPVEVLYDICVNDWGMLGITDPIFNLVSWKAAAEKIWTENNGVSCEIANSQQGADLFKEILRQINGIIYQNPQTGQIEIVLLRQDYVIADLPTLGPSQISSVRNFTKKLWEDTFNQLRIKYKDRNNRYEDAVAYAEDFGNVRFQGRTRSTEVGMPMCYEATLANSLAARELSQLNVPLYGCELVCDRSHTDLVPGSVFVWTWPEYNVAGIVMRVRKMSLGNRKDGKVIYTVVQDEFSADAVVNAPPVPPSIEDPADYAPQNIVAPAFMELPYWLANVAGDLTSAGRTAYATFAKKPGSASLNFSSLIDDNAEDGDTEALATAPYSASAQLVNAVSIYDGFDTGTVATLEVKTVTNVAILSNHTTADIRSTAAGLFLLNGELWAFETKTDHGDGTYSLNNVHRGLLDTRPVASAADSVLYFFQGQEGFWDTDVAVSAFTAYALDHTVTGDGSETSATKVALTPVERQVLPLRPDFLTVEGTREIDQVVISGDTITLDWVERNRLDPSIALEDDATVAAEAGTTYNLKIINASDETVLQTEVGITAPYALALDPAIVGLVVRLELVAVRDGKTSFTPAIFPLTVASPDSLSVDDNVVIVNDATVEF